MSDGEVREKDDEELSREILAGNLDAFRELFRRHAAEVLALSQRILGNRQDAEDVVSDVFFEMWRRRNKFDPLRASVRGFLLMMTRSRSIDRYRANMRSISSNAVTSGEFRDVIEQTTSPPEKLLQLESQQFALAALRELDVAQRQVLELTFFEGLSHAQISSRLEIPLGTVKSHVRRGIAKLRSLMGDETSGRCS